METFTQIIFPPKPKPKPVVVEPLTSTFKNTGYIQNEVYCTPANHWIPMFECVYCKNPKQKLEEILSFGTGC